MNVEYVKEAFVELIPIEKLKRGDSILWSKFALTVSSVGDDYVMAEQFPGDESSTIKLPKHATYYKIKYKTSEFRILDNREDMMIEDLDELIKKR